MARRALRLAPSLLLLCAGCAAAPQEEPPAPLTQPERPPICAVESPELCLQDGVRLYQGLNGNPDKATAKSKFELACSGGEQRGCTWLGIVLAEASTDGLDQSRAFDLWATACDEGVMMACTQIGSRLLNYAWSSGEPESEEAVEIFNAANEGLARACSTEEADDVRNHWGITVRGYACANLAVSHEHGFAVPIDEAKALDLNTQSCDLGWAPGCAAAATMIGEGRGVETPDSNQARQLQTRACKLGHTESCEPTN